MMLARLHRLLFGTLRRQLILGVAAVHAAMMSLFVWDLTQRQQDMLLGQQTSLATALAQSVATSSSVWLAARDLAGLQEIVDAQRRYPELSYAMVLDRDGAVLAHTDRARLGQYLHDLPDRPEMRILSRSRALVDVASPAVVAGRHVGWIRVGVGQLTTSTQLAQITRDGALYALAAIVIGALLAGVMARRLTRRLYAIQSVADAVQAGDSAQRARVRGSDEAAGLARQFNGMLDTLAERERDLLVSRDALHESEERFQRAMLGANDGLWDWNIKTGEVYFSPRWKAMLGYGEDELEDHISTWELLVEPEDYRHAAAVIQDYIEGRRDTYEVEFRMRHKAGHWVHILARGLLVRDENGEALRLTGTHVDISERKEAQEALNRLNLELEARVAQRTRELAESNAQLKDALTTIERAKDELVRSERLASLGSLVAGVAHELNTPLGNSVTVATAMADSVRGLRAEFDAGSLRRSSLQAFIETATQGTDILTRNLYRASELISNFKEVAVDQASAHRRPFDLRETVDEVVFTLQPQFKRTRHRIEVEIPPGIRLDSYPGPLGQVIINLVSNALVHGFEGMDSGVVTIEAGSATDAVTLVVSDNGRGIPLEHQPRIFDPFFTTRMGQGGSGLGMHIVYSLVTRVLGGRIALASRLGEGTTLTLHLPLVAPRYEGSSLGASMAVQSET